ncbi:MAG TPA: PPOX class F420-dependent oxidoreductase [Nocardia sp.]|uniref:PPOX class F420-dependent oxidoreductase n=1 Tax=Nocardia TaxID=1817 RepID=UPI002455F6A5|nr:MULTISPECIES: PPOX class F420-dependent oxidoreductase [Nocardia]HLS78403.1 PPOX class F420-dependent oxidoreductase [Nocardia sp.]
MELTNAIEFARGTKNSVLTALRRDGRPQLSNVLHVIDEAGDILISITADRAKYHNLRRTPWAALHVTSPDFRSYVVLECDVTLTEVATDPHAPGIDALVTYYRTAAGEHPDWEDYRRAMVADRRVLARLIPTRAYGLLPS